MGFDWSSCSQVLYKRIMRWSLSGIWWRIPAGAHVFIELLGVPAAEPLNEAINLLYCVLQGVSYCQSGSGLVHDIKVFNFTNVRNT